MLGGMQDPTADPANMEINSSSLTKNWNQLWIRSNPLQESGEKVGAIEGIVFKEAVFFWKSSLKCRKVSFQSPSESFVLQLSISITVTTMNPGIEDTIVWWKFIFLF